MATESSRKQYLLNEHANILSSIEGARQYLAMLSDQRSVVVTELWEECGRNTTETARLLNLTYAAVFRALNRKRKKLDSK